MSNNRKWGPPLSGDVMKALGLPGDTPCKMEDGDNFAATVGWWPFGGEYNFHLRADHPAYIVADHNAKHGTNFVYWPGGDEAPVDWDAGDVLHGNGEACEVREEGKYVWIRDDPIDRLEIIGYARKTEEPSATLDFTKPVQTRDGRAVRILCTDGPKPDYPVVGYIGDSDTISVWMDDGLFIRGCSRGSDLINVPETVEMWVGMDERSGVGAGGHVAQRSDLWDGWTHHVRFTWTDGVPSVAVFKADEDADQ